jgi:hypothetical protein
LSDFDKLFFEMQVINEAVLVGTSEDGRRPAGEVWKGLKKSGERISHIFQLEIGNFQAKL